MSEADRAYLLSTDVKFIPFVAPQNQSYGIYPEAVLRTIPPISLASATKVVEAETSPGLMLRVLCVALPPNPQLRSHEPVL